jgi:hypothetical protein
MGAAKMLALNFSRSLGLTAQDGSAAANSSKLALTGPAKNRATKTRIAYHRISGGVIFVKNKGVTATYEKKEAKERNR